LAESFQNLDNTLYDWEKDKNKKSIVEVLNGHEKHSLVGKKMIKPFCSSENGKEKILQHSAETKPNTKLVGKPRTIA